MIVERPKVKLKIFFQLFEMQERHKTLGCTLVMTSNHLITLREDFTAPLRRVNAVTSGVMSPPKGLIANATRKLSVSTITTDTMNDVRVAGDLFSALF